MRDEASFGSSRHLEMAEIGPHTRPSQFFTVRVWTEDLGERRREFRGQARHVMSGATRNFREWADLEAFLIRTFDDCEGGTDGEADGR